ncbi:MAG: MoaD/ThiS family protein [Coriobacteriales bacterium]|nr:MoaD/ThiS family protein [Coriobacteriales bacterium]
MTSNGAVEVRMFGVLHTLRCQRGQSPRARVDVPAEGRAARDIAMELGLPLDQIEGVLCNHDAFGLGHVVRPGDRLAFVPYGTPGPHRFFLGLYAAGKENDEA